MIREIQQYCGPDLPYIVGAKLDYVFASRSIAHRLTVRALNAPKDWLGWVRQFDHCNGSIVPILILRSSEALPDP